MNSRIVKYTINRFPSLMKCQSKVRTFTTTFYICGDKTGSETYPLTSLREEHLDNNLVMRRQWGRLFWTDRKWVYLWSSVNNKSRFWFITTFHYGRKRKEKRITTIKTHELHNTVLSPKTRRKRRDSHAKALKVKNWKLNSNKNDLLKVMT